jgi:hypothetical protein
MALHGKILSTGVPKRAVFEGHVMNRGQRIIIAVYLLFVALSLMWVPWRLPDPEMPQKLGYGFLWAGPYHPKITVPQATATTQNTDPPVPEGYSVADIFDIVAEEHREDMYAAPDYPRIALRLAILTCLAGSALLFSSLATLRRKVS